MLPKIKSENPLRHDADAWVKIARNTLGPLLAVAEGQTPGSARRIIDIDLSLIPPLAEEHRGSQLRNSQWGVGVGGSPQLSAGVADSEAAPRR